MGSGIGVFTDQEVQNLSNDEKLELRADVIKELLKSVPEVLKLRETLAPKHKINLQPPR